MKYLLPRLHRRITVYKDQQNKSKNKQYDLKKIEVIVNEILSEHLRKLLKHSSAKSVEEKSI